MALHINLVMTPERKAKIQRVLNYRQNDLTVVLENVTDPHNISAVMRTCDAVGIMEIFILNTKIPKHKKFGDRSSSSALKWVVTHQYTDAKECFKAIRGKYQQIYSTHLGKDSIALHSIDFTVPTALVFGNESEGVSEEVLAFCDGNFIIPQVGMIQSLNISVACAVSIYEAYRQKEQAGHYAAPKVSKADTTALMNHWDSPEFFE